MPNPRRRLALSALTAVFILAGATAAGWWWLEGRWHTSTDDAYVQGNLVQLTPQIAGIVIRINADDTALVREGDPVVVLDDADTRSALDEAKAGLAQAVRRVRQLYANTDALRASVELRRAEWRRAREDLQRRTGLPDARALAEEDLKHAQAQLESAAAALRAAEHQLAASEAMVSRTTVETHPDVKQAAAKLRESYLAAQRASVLAPVTGYVAKRSVHTSASASRPRSPPTCTAARSRITAPSSGSGRARAARSRCCRRKTRPATGSRSCSGCRCASGSTRRSSRRTRCGSGCR